MTATTSGISAEPQLSPTDRAKGAEQIDSSFEEKKKSPSNSSRLLAEILQEIKIQTQTLAKLQTEVNNIKDTLEKKPKEEDDINDVSFIIKANYKLWQDTLKRRNTAFFNGLKNFEKSKYYEEYLKRDPPYIPRNCREKIFGTHTQGNEEWKLITSEREIDNVKHSIKKMTAMAKTHQKTIDETDNKIKETFEHLPEPQRNQIWIAWEKEIKAGESANRAAWTPKGEFFRDLPDKEETDEDKAEDNQQRTERKPRPKEDTNRHQQASAGPRRDFANPPRENSGWKPFSPKNNNKYNNKPNPKGKKQNFQFPQAKKKTK